MEEARCALVSLDERTVCSGILLADDWVLSHGSLLRHSVVDLAALDDGPTALQLELRVRHQSGPELLERAGSRSFAWRCPLLRRAFAELLSAWSFDDARGLLTVFVLVAPDGLGDAAAAAASLARLLAVLPEGAARGAALELESAPFACPDFLGSVSRGLASNLLADGCLLMSDAPALPGCEGAPVFALRRGGRRLVGMLLTSRSWCRGELVGHSFAASLRPCLQRLLRANDPSAAPSTAPSTAPVDSLDGSLALVRCGAGWGTGVLLDYETVLTCSHVVREPAARRRLDNRGARSRDHSRDRRSSRSSPCLTSLNCLSQSASKSVRVGTEEAQLVYRTPDERPYDVAVLRLPRGGRCRRWRFLELAEQLPHKGTPVLTAGFPFFGGDAPPSYSRGVVSRVTPHVVQTSCCVQSGTSGGPVVDALTGRMLALVVSNIKSAGPSPVLYPRFNMAVPSSVLRRPIVDFMRTGDVSCLESLSSDDPSVHETWSYNLTPRSKI
ncbi:peroxisomal leader peptide-processing protease-like isoform X2 [Phymastichus coffea]|uniref:peroxisomal leader peptide-processing protease-like isoform X2 n=1 Tax=Phymastichus coffea TaxID=108790 RepID=UPI00273B2131|nr:peroxisomal leader peptide-processing protease-like isoform X2 [Phymastichus coffea]